MSRGLRIRLRWSDSVGGASVAPLKILLAEDSIPNQKVALPSILEGGGHSVVVAASGQEALEQLRIGTFDVVVLMDVQMPEMDGFEATAQCQMKKGRGQHQAIIALTARALQDRGIWRRGWTSYVTKPVRRAELGQVLSRVVRRSGLQGSLGTAIARKEFGEISRRPELAGRCRAASRSGRPADADERRLERFAGHRWLGVKVD